MMSGSHPCPKDCNCGKHSVRNSGQFRLGSSGFRGPHTEAAKEKLRQARAQQTNQPRPPKAGDPSHRFDAMVMHEPNTGCHLWMGALTHGYGVFGIGSMYDGSRCVVRTHRFAYERANGPVPDGLELDHLCFQKSCVNPDHLEAVTHAENLRRARERISA